MDKIQLRIYSPTTHRGLRFRLIGVSNKYIAFDYAYNSVLDQAKDIINDNGYQIDNIANARGGNYNIYLKNA